MRLSWFFRRPKRDEHLADHRQGRSVRQIVFRPVLEALEDRLAPAVVNWIGSGSGNWDNAANWSSGNVPGPTDDVVINTTSAATITIQSGDDLSLKSLMMGTQVALSVTGGSLVVAANSPLSGSLSMTGGSLTAAGPGVTLQVTGTTSVSEAACSPRVGQP